MNRLVILAAWLAVNAFLTIAATGCLTVQRFNEYRANLFHHAQE